LVWFFQLLKPLNQSLFYILYCLISWILESAGAEAEAIRPRLLEFPLHRARTKEKEKEKEKIK
jgi:hypothetical protein